MVVLLTGYTQLAQGFDSYHWKIVVDLEWSAALVHLATLTSLRTYFRNRLAMAICRAGIMDVVLILLIVAFMTTGYDSQYDINELSWPAECLYSRTSMSVVEKANSDACQNYGSRPRTIRHWLCCRSVFSSSAI